MVSGFPSWKRVQHSRPSPLPSAEENAFTVSRTFALKTRPESGLDCLICAIVARQRPAAEPLGLAGHRKVDIRLPGRGNSNPHGARPVHQIISMIKWMRTSRLSINHSLSRAGYESPMAWSAGNSGWRVRQETDDARDQSDAVVLELVPVPPLSSLEYSRTVDRAVTNAGRCSGGLSTPLSCSLT